MNDPPKNCLAIKNKKNNNSNTDLFSFLFLFLSLLFLGFNDAEENFCGLIRLMEALCLPLRDGENATPDLVVFLG